LHINQTNNKNKIGTAIVIVTVLLACCLSVGVVSAASDSNYQDNMPMPSGRPDFNGGNFTFPDDMNPFNGTDGPGGQGGFMGSNGTFPNGMNGNFSRPDFSGAPGEAQPFNSQNQVTAQTDYTLLIVGIAIAAVIIVIVLVVMLKKRKNKPEASSVDLAAPPPPTKEAYASL
jgi:hypothetical protein